jgi:hypothetical protein
MQCEECGETLLTHHAEKDRNRWIWCRVCGLVIDPDHPQGRGISGLMAWLRVYGVKKNDMQNITAIYVNNNLRDARLASIPLVESYLKRQIL